MTAGVVIVLGVVPAAAEQWSVYPGAQASWAVDTDTLNTDANGKAKVVYGSYAVKPNTVDGKTVSYVIAQVLYDCAAETMRPNEMALFDDAGKPLEDRTAPAGLAPTPIDNVDVVNQLLFDAACYGDNLPDGALRSADIRSAMKAMKGK